MELQITVGRKISHAADIASVVLTLTNTVEDEALGNPSTGQKMIIMVETMMIDLTRVAIMMMVTMAMGVIEVTLLRILVGIVHLPIIMILQIEIMIMMTMAIHTPYMATGITQTYVIPVTPTKIDLHKGINSTVMSMLIMTLTQIRNQTSPVHQ